MYSMDNANKGGDVDGGYARDGGAEKRRREVSGPCGLAASRIAGGAV